MKNIFKVKTCVTCGQVCGRNCNMIFFFKRPVVLNWWNICNGNPPNWKKWNVTRLRKVTIFSQSNSLYLFICSPSRSIKWFLHRQTRRISSSSPTIVSVYFLSWVFLLLAELFAVDCGSRWAFPSHRDVLYVELVGHHRCDCTALHYHHINVPSWYGKANYLF